jgi:hypothetical protein
MKQREHQRNIYNRKVTFAREAIHYVGLIDNISAGGVHVITDQAADMPAGEAITLTLSNAEKEKTTRNAVIIWADATGFGAKFISS